MAQKIYKDFIQTPPHLGNQYEEDSLLVSLVQRHLSSHPLYSSIVSDFTRFGARCSSELMQLCDEMETNQPTLQTYDAWGQRVDLIHTCAAWKKMHIVSAEEGIVANGYEQKYGIHNRIVQFMKLYMFAPSSGLYSCPLAMTDGAAKLCQMLLTHIEQPNKSEVSSSAPPIPSSSALHQQLLSTYAHLTSRVGPEFWTSGQWMTEREGGSDVGSGTNTIATPQSDGSYLLYGFKWFTSATDANITITLARIADANGRVTPGSKGISCFLVRVRKDNGELNGIQIQKLKQKLGTKQLPTAELELNGCVAHLLSLPGRGIPLITNLVNITRLYNTVSAAGGMRRAVALQRDYVHRRMVFGKLLADNSLHLETLANLEVQSRVALLTTIDAVEKLGRIEGQQPHKHDAALLRILTPLLKLYTGKQAVYVASETLESFGGQGFMEDSKLPRLYRDAQVLPIWEGTTNVLSHDVLRVIAQTKGKIIQIIGEAIKQRVDTANKQQSTIKGELHQRFNNIITSIHTSLQQIDSFFKFCSAPGIGAASLAAHARPLSFSLFRTWSAGVLLDHFMATQLYIDFIALERWTTEGASGVGGITSSHLVDAVIANVSLTASSRDADTRILALDIDPLTNQARGFGPLNKDGTPRCRL